MKLGAEEERAGYQPHGCFCVLSPLNSDVGKTLAFYVVMATPNSRNKTIAVLRSPLADPSAPLKEWVAAIAANHPDGPAVLPDAIRLVSHLAKTFLYLGMKEARARNLNDHTELKARLARVERKKQGKLEKRLQRLYDRIIVGPDALPQELRQGPAAHGVSPHWRRGHFRQQAHGLANSLRKLIFVRPTLVAANPAVLQDELTPKTYSVRR
ncbi:hypothetical protein [Polaromonas sp. JS666]|uniref:hypothetical protein n=1 Tax=Polaromonas sp. (strain JS666 / ATCC BAA-500) TaxID=296591 RepID=UPI0000532C9D|nr:hypothetical protein [Polaromonas sp. JS666]ABE47337.1 hypothetical protein Bpro_5483 [Polaromonas sp. JS666]